MDRKQIEFEIWELEHARALAETYAKQCTTPHVMELHKSYIESCNKLINELKLELNKENS